MTHLDELRANYRITRRWQPQMGEDERARGVAAWRRGVDRTLDWRRGSRTMLERTGIAAAPRKARDSVRWSRQLVERARQELERSPMNAGGIVRGPGGCPLSASPFVIGAK
jgi:hypothetical protein